MSVTIDASVGGSGSNSYQDPDAVQAILDGVPNSATWTALENTDGAQETICAYATMLLDVMAYLGRKVTTAQALAWPRYGVEDPDFGDGCVLLSSTAYPRRLLRAHAMLCLELARAGTSEVWGVDPSLDVAEKTIDVITTRFVDPARRRVGLRKYPSVWRELLPLLAASRPQAVERA